MRKILTISLFCVVLASATSALAQTKLDPYLQMQDAEEALLPKALSLSLPENAVDPAKELVEVFIKCTDSAAVREAVEAEGGTVETVVGSIIIARIPPSSAKDIAASEAVKFVEAAKPIQLKNDIARGEINGDEVLSGQSLPTPLTGKGVIVGIIDTGIDYSHPDFQDENGSSRVLAIWDQNRNNGRGPDEITNTFGMECLSDSIEDGSCPLGDADGHGTHVSGTAAGRNSSYGGMAPDAKIVAVTYDSSLDISTGYAEPISSTKICQAAYYIFAKADALGMPAVVNMSLGTHIGPHDGTSLFEDCLAELVKGSAGRAIVAAAGNEYSADSTYTGIHAGFSPQGTQAANFVIRQASRDRIYYVDIWGAAGSDLSFALAFRHGAPPRSPSEQTVFVAPGEKKSGAFLGGSIGWSINATETASVLNGKPHVGIRITLGQDVSNPKDYSFDLVVKGTGSFDAWLFPDKPARTIQFTSAEGEKGAEWTFVSGDRQKSVAMPATSPDIIAVGGYTTRNRWSSPTNANCCQVPYALGAILDFSSSGPSADPSFTGPKPDIVAPGGMIASTLSTTARPNSSLMMDTLSHSLQAGTSMATPFVSGTIALMFSADPNYTHNDVRRYITESAYQDGNTGNELPNNRWGFGKLDTLAAIEAAIEGGASGSFAGNSAINAPAEKSEGGKSCTLVAGANEVDPSALTMLAAMIPIVLIRRKAKPQRRRA
ncbi:MAG TPA: S8 family serine peptidase [bacterium]|nr:S8 family serine peptidase [bacterium]